MIADPSADAGPSRDVAGLHAALAGTVAGEVRFDRLSRALYSTDASVYQIVPAGRRPAQDGGRRRGHGRGLCPVPACR